MVERLLTWTRSGHSGVLVVRGEAGIGKTAILDHARAVASGTGFRVEHAVGVESESQFAFAGLHQLCSAMLERADALPEPQRLAVRVAFGLCGGPPPDRFLVGLAVLNLLTEVAEGGQLLCVVDDAQWLDEASVQVLTFVSRRLAAEPVALMFGLRDGDGDPLAYAGLPDLRLDGLSDADARELLTAVVHRRLEDGVRERVVAEARGNPLALLELPHDPAAVQLAGGFGLPDVTSVPRRVEDSFRARSAELPEQTQQLLLVAAAEPTGDPGLLWRAGAALGIAPEAAAPAEEVGLLDIGSRVRFRHPLVRSAVYRSAAATDQRRVHAALADATDAEVDPDRAAWHRALAVHGADEAVAADLERSADRALARGGFAAAGALLRQATELTPEPGDRARRALAAAHATHEAGASEVALEMLRVAETGPLDEPQRAQLMLQRAEIAFHTTRGRNAVSLMVDAADSLCAVDPELASETMLQALDAAIINGGPEAMAVAEDAMASESRLPLRPVDQLLRALAVMMTQGYAAGVPRLREALEQVHEAESGGVAPTRSQAVLWLAGRSAVGILDDHLAHVLTEGHVRLTRAAGALAGLPAALGLRANVLILGGSLAQANELATEAEAITSSTGGVPMRHSRTILAGWCGDEAAAVELSGRTIQEAAHPEEGTDVALARYALAVLRNGLGEYPVAQEEAARAADSVELSVSTVALPELVEAAARAGDTVAASRAMERLSMRTRACGTSWASGLEARCRALLSDGTQAEDHYRTAVEHLGASRMAGETARAHLLYGEWLRREGRRHEARDRLRTAHGLLTDMGAQAFAERAARELRATGEHPRARSVQPTDALTAHELHIARLVATGATSREVGAQLFLSPRTIEAHLRNIFRKLGITSRRQLRELSLP